MARGSFLQAIDASGIERPAVAGWMAAVIEGLDWRDPDGERAAVPPGDLLLCSTFGETVAESVESRVGRFVVRYPGPGQQRAAGLVAVDEVALTASIDDLVAELLALGDPDADAATEIFALEAARAVQPEAEFRWTGRGVSQAYRVVGEVEFWPGQIQLQAARVHEPAIRIGDSLWLADRELLPVCWVLDWLAG